MKNNKYQAVVLGDSFNNTLGLIRSLGEAAVDIILILVAEEDRLFVSRSRYLKPHQIHTINKIGESLDILKRVHNSSFKQYLICSNDRAAEFVDKHEAELSSMFITPMRGRRIGHFFNKDSQCRLAAHCGFRVPISFTYHVNELFPSNLDYPILLKPLNSNTGAKSDIHICNSIDEVKICLKHETACTDFIVQEYIDKEYELNLIGVRTDVGTFVPGGIQKLRHYPTIYSPCSYGLFQSIDAYNVDVDCINRFLNEIGYYGPFSVELLHKNGKNYFMEFNFRHDGLAYTATAAGCNLLGLYVYRGKSLSKPHSVYMMDLSADYNHVKDGHISFMSWIKDFMRTGCQLNFNRKDPFPTITYYKHKFSRLFK